MPEALATIAILSIGQMGLGIAQLLIAHNYRIITNVSNRSPSTQQRAESASIELVPTDVALVSAADYVFSIVPPRDAVTTAKRIVTALQSSDCARAKNQNPLYYLDLNAIAPSTAREIAALFTTNLPYPTRFIDGGIIGGPPAPPTSHPYAPNPPATTPSAWSLPGVPLSGPNLLTSAPLSGTHLAATLNARHLDPTIGSASGLKCTFASLSKGLTALSLQSYTTASALGVLPHLRYYLALYNPSAAKKAEAGIVGCPAKAYRWVEEMRQIGRCFGEDGGWGDEAGVFGMVAGVFRELAEVVEERGGTQGMGEVEEALEALRSGLRRMKEDET